MKTVVTGGAGFIGSHLAEEAVARGQYGVIIDNLFSGKTANIEREQTRDLIYVKDVIAATMLPAEGYMIGPMNVARGESV